MHCALRKVALPNFRNFVVCKYYNIVVLVPTIPIGLLCTLGLKMFGVGGLYMKLNAYVPEGRNERRRVATPTNFSIFDSYDMKRL